MKPSSRPLLPLILLLLSLATLEGCVGTRTAYKAAQDTGDPTVYAYVVGEHYSALLKEAADLKDAGKLTGNALATAQAADRKAKPLIIGDPSADPPKAGVQQLSETYKATQGTADKAALQKALNDAVKAISEFINSLKGARS